MMNVTVTTAMALLQALAVVVTILIDIILPLHIMFVVYHVNQVMVDEVAAVT